MAKTIEKNNLGYLGENYQKQLIKLLIEDGKFFTSIGDILDQNMFTIDYMRRLVGYMKDRYTLTNGSVTYPDLDIIVRSKVTDGKTAEILTAFLEELKNMDFVGVDLIKDNAEKFFKQQYLTKALNQAQEIIKKGDDSSYNNIIDLFQKALEVNLKADDGIVGVLDDIEGTLSQEYREPIPTGCDALDKKLLGGLGRGELGVIIAPTGCGKTSATTGFCAHAATYKCAANNYKGYKVFHVFFEDKVRDVRRKYFGYITGIEAMHLSKPENKQVVLEELDKDDKGEMIRRNIKMYRATNAEFSASDLRIKLNHLIASGFVPDLVVFDYFECAKLEKSESSADSEWTREGLTMRKFESIANELNIALWVPVQGSKDSLEEAFVGLKHAGGSVKKVQIGHVIISFARTSDMVARNLINVGVNKFRAGAIVGGGMLQGIELNNGTCRFNTENMEEVESETEDIFQKDSIDAQRNAFKTIK